MKTIEEAAKEYVQSRPYSTLETPKLKDEAYDGFNVGVEFAQRWIDVEDELPPVNELVIAKYLNYEDEKILLLNYQGDEAELDYVCEWRPIELK